MSFGDKQSQSIAHTVTQSLSTSVSMVLDLETWVTVSGYLL